MADDADPGMNVPAPPFASADDLASRWYELTDAERAKAETMLADASDKIITDCPNWAQASETTLRRICCAMVKRAMLNEDVAGSPNPRRPRTVSPRPTATATLTGICI